MTQITRQVEIAAPLEKVWAHIDPKNWTKTFTFVKTVDGHADGTPGVGTQATIEAGEGGPMVKYNIEITEFLEKETIEYRRYGGPLPGKGRMRLKPLQNYTVFSRTSYYEDDLSEETIQTLSAGMERDNQKLKRLVEERN